MAAMIENIDIGQVKKLAETLKAFRSHQTMLMSFLPVLESLTELLHQEKRNLIDNHLRLSEQDCALYETTANLYKIICYNCIHNNPTPQTIKFAQFCGEIEHLLMTNVQHSKGCLDESAGYFYATEQNLSALCEASLNVLEATDTSEPINFIQIA
jgi:hypothetical protein